MRANRRTDTKPELALRHALHRLGYRYRKDYRLDLDGGRRVRPDIAFTARKVAVFVDGCFWHVCPEHGSKPTQVHRVHHIANSLKDHLDFLRPFLYDKHS